MALLDLWHRSRSELELKRVHQVLAIAGSGKLQDGSETADEFRGFLRDVPTRLLVRYAEECLSEKFDQAWFALQDVINEIGRRLGFEVQNGRYKGAQGHSGHDGLWSSSAGSLVVEVKTTDAYRINLDTLASYRRQLIHAGQIVEDGSSILIIVGRQDTGDLEAQIRGSRYGWNIRLISVDALVRLAMLKETVDDPAIVRKVSGILTPQEFTRVDGIIDLVFSTAEDVKADSVDLEDADESRVSDKNSQPASAFYEACIRRAAQYLRTPLSRESRTFYLSGDRQIGVLCLVSKIHTSKSMRRCWFGFHPKHKELLSSVPNGYIALGCGAPDRLLVIPWRDFQPWIDGMFTTESDGRFYWHISIDTTKLELLRRKGQPRLELSTYLLDDKMPTSARISPSSAKQQKPPNSRARQA